MNLEILVSTYQSRLLKNKVQSEQLSLHGHIIVDQSPVKQSEYPEKLNIIPVLNETGLTKSRNKAIALSKGDLLLIADDDLEYIEGFQETILSSFNENPNAAMISFQILKPDGMPFKNYKQEKYIHNKRTVISTSSVELVFRKSILDKYKLSFDENFGVNAKFPCGEEAVLLGKMLDLNLELLSIPKPICIHPEESSGKDYDRKGLLLAKGAMIRKLFGFVGFFLLFIFIMKNFRKIMTSKARVTELFLGYFQA